MKHMFLAVLVASALFVLAARGISAADSCIASLPAVAIKTGECPALRHGETINEVKQNVSTLLQDIVHCMLLGHTQLPQCI